MLTRVHRLHGSRGTRCRCKRCSPLRLPSNIPYKLGTCVFLHGNKEPITTWTRNGHHRGAWNVRLFSQHLKICSQFHSYFSRYALEEVYLKDPKYAKYINAELLDKYYPVGGVRIEDDLLVTENGFENLTKDVPKGDEALKIINGEKEKRGWFW
jgi:hypothetical protein